MTKNWRDKMLVIITGNGADKPIHYRVTLDRTACGISADSLRYANFGTHRQVNCKRCRRATAYRNAESIRSTGDWR